MEPYDVFTGRSSDTRHLAVGTDAAQGVEPVLTEQFIEAVLRELGVAENGSKRGPQFVANVGSLPPPAAFLIAIGRCGRTDGRQP